MDQKLARKNLRSGLLATFICFFMFGMTFVASMGLGALFIAGAVTLYRRADRRSALRLYLFSLLYLALLFGAMVLDAKL